jgi:hypothetical protein
VPVGLKPLPDTFAETREALHRVAEQLVAPARKPHNEIALTATPGGFGTPDFEFEGRRMRVRAEGADLVLETDGEERRAELTSLAEGGALLGAQLLPDGIPDDSTPLDIDPEAAERLGDFYAFAAAVLERLRSELPGDAASSQINLWPEHFDIAFEAGSDAEGRRANYGASPGDEAHPLPYLYVGPWSAEVEGELWHASGFTGAELGYAELLAAGDPERVALEFFDSRFQALAASS